MKGGELIEDRKSLRLRRRQTVDGHFLTPQGLAAFVYLSLLYKSLLFNLKVRTNVVSLQLLEESQNIIHVLICYDIVNIVLWIFKKCFGVLLMWTLNMYIMMRFKFKAKSLIQILFIGSQSLKLYCRTPFRCTAIGGLPMMQWELVFHSSLLTTHLFATICMSLTFVPVFQLYSWQMAPPTKTWLCQGSLQGSSSPPPLESDYSQWISWLVFMLIFGNCLPLQDKMLSDNEMVVYKRNYSELIT